jgi:hypothetical protein
MLNLKEQQFGRLTAIHEGSRSRTGRRRWYCRCTCGRTTLVHQSALRSGNTRSCGCAVGERIGALRRTHGETHRGANSPEYVTWTSMRHRCRNPRAHDYRHYGGRGITICERWDRFENFLADMGRKPSRAHTLERIDNDGLYSPSNCRWATIQEQACNRRSKHSLTFDGKTQSVLEWATELGMRPTTLYSRLDRGWDTARAIVAPVRHRSNQSLDRLLK